MNTLCLLRKSGTKTQIIALARYGKPLNRWKWHYANEDGIFEEDLNWIERKKMPQPFPANDFIYSHKGFPAINNPFHKNDVRYDFKIENWPRRHHVNDFQFKIYNYSDWDQAMHSMQWVDHELDYQVADPMESNHYVQGRSPSYMIIMAIVLFTFTVVYPLWGYGVLEAPEDPYKLRKIFQFPDASLVFTWLASFPGDLMGLDKDNLPGTMTLPGARTDKDGNILPNAIRRYSFEDEYTYRI